MSISPQEAGITPPSEPVPYDVVRQLFTADTELHLAVAGLILRQPHEEFRRAGMCQALDAMQGDEPAWSPATQSVRVALNELAGAGLVDVRRTEEGRRHVLVSSAIAEPGAHLAAIGQGMNWARTYLHTPRSWVVKPTEFVVRELPQAPRIQFELLRVLTQQPRSATGDKPVTYQQAVDLMGLPDELDPLDLAPLVHQLRSAGLVRAKFTGRANSAVSLAPAHSAAIRAFVLGVDMITTSAAAAREYYRTGLWLLSSNPAMRTIFAKAKTFVPKGGERGMPMPTEERILGALGKRGPLTLTEIRHVIGSERGYSTANVATLLTALSVQGMVRQVRANRMHLYELPPEGKTQP
jgi:penicillinase repressor